MVDAPVILTSVIAKDPRTTEGLRSTNLNELSSIELSIVHLSNNIEGIDEDDDGG